MAKLTSNRLCVSVTGNDRPGIIAAVTGVFYHLGANLEDVSMTILNGEFAMILIVSFPKTLKGDQLSQKLNALNKKFKLDIEIRPAVKKSWSKQTSNNSYMINVFGADQKGIVHRVSNIIAGLKLNITDLQSKLIPSGKKIVYGLFLEVDAPKNFKITELESQLSKLAHQLKVQISVKPVEALTL